MLFESEAAAAAEMEMLADEQDGAVEPVAAWRATDALEKHWATTFAGPIDLSSVEEVAHLLVLERLNRWDGVWWHEQLDPLGLSAPRGVLFANAQKRWVAQRQGGGQKAISLAAIQPPNSER